MSILKPYNVSSAISFASDVLLAEKAIPLFRHHLDRRHYLDSQLTPKAALVLLLKTQFDRSLVNNFFYWACSRPFFDLRCKCISLHILTRFGRYNTAQTLAEQLAQSDTSGFSVFEILKESFNECNSSSEVFDLLVKSFCRLNMVDSSVSIIDLTDYSGFILDISSYELVLGAISRSPGSVDLVEHLYGLMKKSGISPTVYCYNILLKSFCTERSIEEGLSIFIEMEKYRCLPNVFTFNTLMHAYCKSGRMKEAYEVFQSMVLRGSQPSTISYNIILNGLCRKGMTREIMEILKAMKHGGVGPDDFTYTILISEYCRAGKISETLVLYDDMVRNGLFPNIFTYTALINSMCKAGNMKQAMFFLDEMRDRGLYPDDNTYSTLINGFCQNVSLRDAYCVLNEMIKSGFAPSVMTYNVLIKGHCVVGEIEAALGLVEDMIWQEGLCPNLITYNILISEFCRQGDMEKALKLLRDLDGEGDAMMYKRLINGLLARNRLTDACDLFNEMLGMDLSPDEFMFTSLIRALCREGDVEKAVLFNDEMARKGFLPGLSYRVFINEMWRHAHTRESRQLLFSLFYIEQVPIEITYDILTESCGIIERKSLVYVTKELVMKGMMDQVDQVFESMYQRDNMPSEAVYNVVVHGHCRVGDVRKAYKLYKEMVRHGFIVHALCVIALVKALSKHGMSVELGEVAGNVLRRCGVTDDAAMVCREENVDGILDVLSKFAQHWVLSSEENQSNG